MTYSAGRLTPSGCGSRYITLGDFGISARSADVIGMDSGTPGCVAPEVLQRSGFGQVCDTRLRTRVDTFLLASLGKCTDCRLVVPRDPYDHPFAWPQPLSWRLWSDRAVNTVLKLCSISFFVACVGRHTPWDILGMESLKAAFWADLSPFHRTSLRLLFCSISVELHLSCDIFDKPSFTHSVEMPTPHSMSDPCRPGCAC